LLSGNLKFIPIINYRWKIQNSIEKRSIWEQFKDYWKRVKNLLSFKKISEGLEIKISEWDKNGVQTELSLSITEKEFDSFPQRAFRTKPIIPTVIKVEKVNPNIMDNPNYIQNEYCTPLKYLKRLELYKNLENFYVVSLSVSLNEEIVNFLEDFTFLMFDLLYLDGSLEKRINYHSLVLSKNDWKNFNIVQATDLHVAERNDHMIKKIEDSYKKEDPESNLEKANLVSLRERIVNPNDHLRGFIKEMNANVFQNKLDMIFCTGDLVDFTISSLKSPEQENNFEYEKSNWKVFKDIILNSYEPPTIEILEPEELLCPIFTNLGNHDYKPWQYDLSWFGMYKKVGLKKSEAEALKEEYSVSRIRAILKSQNAIDAYLAEINPSLNYSLKFGQVLFIFINSGADSYKELGDYVTGSPSLTGITEHQVKYLENVVNLKKEKGDTVILALHGPPINTPLKRGIFTRIEKIFRKEKKVDLDEFRESNFKGSKNRLQDARIDDKFNLEYGTISSNWEFTFEYCFKQCLLTLSGHTHMLNEYRLSLMNNEETNEPEIAVYYDDYSNMFWNSNKIKKNGPFVVQTPALGFKSYKRPGRVAGYRLLKFKNGKLSSFQVKYVKINQYKRKKDQ